MWLALKEKQAVTSKLRSKYAANIIRNGVKKKTKPNKPKLKFGRPPKYDVQVFLALRRTCSMAG